MAWTPVPTVKDGDLWTAADHNKYIRDNFAEEPPSGFTGKGQLRIGTTQNVTGIFAAVNYPYGALFADSSQPYGMACYTYVPGAIISAGSGTIPDNIETIVTGFGSNLYDWGGLQEPGHTYMQIPTGLGGTYHINIGGQWAVSATTRKARQIGVVCSHAGNFEVTDMQSVDAVGPYQNTSFIVDLIDGETVKFTAFQISGGNLNIGGCWLALARIQ